MFMDCQFAAWNGGCAVLQVTHLLLGYMRMGCPQVRMNREEGDRRSVDLAAWLLVVMNKKRWFHNCLSGFYLHDRPSVTFPICYRPLLPLPPLLLLLPLRPRTDRAVAWYLLGPVYSLNLRNRPRRLPGHKNLDPIWVNHNLGHEISKFY